MNSLVCRIGEVIALSALLGLAPLAGLHLQAAEDLLLADFEGEGYGAWEVVGEAFGRGPAQGTLPNQMAVDGFQGKRLVNSFSGGDGATGKLTSPQFSLQRRYLRFLIGGGGDSARTCMNLLVDGKVVRTATGPNIQPGGSEHLDGMEWDVSEFAGQGARIEIIDQATGGWGHINVDHILQTDQKLPGWITNATREFTVAKRFLNLPVKNGAPKRVVTLLLDGKVQRQFEMELSDQAPDWWAVLDLTPFRERSVTIQVDKLPENSSGLGSIEPSDEPKSIREVYGEELRPQFHFSSQRGWLNDPNGLVYQQGEYHLFYQHNPYGWNWGNMHWGHAVSRDLVHWQELGEALYPDSLGTMFSGSAVVDRTHSAGFASGEEPALVCIYTAAGGTSLQSKGAKFSQCLAYSTDRGRTWTKYANNPVLSHLRAENRDPKVIWYAPGQKWVMALYLDQSDFALFASTDLKHWEKLSDVTIPGTSECPEFFEIPIVDEPAATRWIFYGGNGRYLVGTFDGKKFSAESGPHPLQFGNCFYASQTYNQLPEQDGRRILVPWGQVSLPGMPFNQMMGLPVELTLRKTVEGLRLHANPVRELSKLRTESHSIPAQTLRAGENPLATFPGELVDIEAEMGVGQAERIDFNLRGVAVVYDVRQQELSCGDRKAALRPRDGKIRLRLLVDRTSIDIFGNDGQLYMPMGVILASKNHQLGISAQGGAAEIRSLQVHRLKSTWRE